jgi:hypothetical protein
MIKKIFLSFLRILFTTIGLLLCKYYNLPMYIIFILLLIGDSIDCYGGKITDYSYCKTHEYQKIDKIIDIVSYILFLLINPGIPDIYMYTYISFLLWRIIGVYRFYFNGNTDELHLFFDGINSTMLVQSLLQYKKTDKTTIIILLIISSISKIFYERYHHHLKKYN